MLTLLLSLLGSSGFGSLLGLLGGVLNRFIDYKYKKQDQDFELAKLDKQREFMKDEYQARLDVATVEAEGEVEKAGYNALAASYSFAVPTAADGWVDKASKLVRPFLTICFFFFTLYIFGKISSLIGGFEKLTQTELISIWKTVIDWVLFQAGVSIGWWFAMRPGKFLGRK